MAPFQTLDYHKDDALENENKATLTEKTWADLIALCLERKLNAEGDKDTLIKLLLDWKQNTVPVPAPSTPRLLSTNESSSPRQNGLNSVLMASLFIDDDTSEIKYDDLEIGERLGSGGFKDCFAGKYNGHPVAIGELRIANFSETDLRETKHEINVLKQLRHDNIVQFTGVSTNSKHLCIITELCENGDLFDYMRKVPKPPFTQQIMFMHDIALGITYLHTRRPSIIHRDLKSMNILISANLRAKINDFGLARIRPRANVDVYAAALIFWEIMTWGEAGYPYQSFSEHQLYAAVRDHNIRPPIDNLRNYPVTLLTLVQLMWQKDPRARPSMSQVVDALVIYLS